MPPNGANFVSIRRSFVPNDKALVPNWDVSHFARNERRSVSFRMGGILVRVRGVLCKFSSEWELFFSRGGGCSERDDSIFEYGGAPGLCAVPCTGM